MKVKEIMTKNALQYCSPETQLQNAAKTMKDENIGVLPVIDKNKNVIGIITDRDIALTLAEKQSEPHAKLNVSDIMAEDVVTVNENENLIAALKEMRENQVGRMPVVDDNGKLSGILSLHRILNKSMEGGKPELGNLSSSEETLAKTVRAIGQRYLAGHTVEKSGEKNVEKTSEKIVGKATEKVVGKVAEKASSATKKTKVEA